MKIFRFTPLLLLAAISIGVAGCGGKDSADECLIRGTERAEKGDWPAALKLAKRAASLEPENVSALVFKAIAHERSGERDPALDAARQAATINPNSFLAQYTLGRLYAGDPTRCADAMKTLSTALTLKPGDVNTLILLGNAATALRSPLAVPYLLQLKKRPEFAADPLLDNQLAIGWISQGNLDQAKQSLTAACRTGGSNPDIVYNMAFFMDRYTRSNANARALYQHFLRQTAGKEEYTALRLRVEERLRNLR